MTVKFKACFSTGKDDWETPEDFFSEQEKEYGPFTLDACASATNAKCARFFDEKKDGLAQPWFGVVWCNPPYSRGQPDKWIEKALAEIRAGRAKRVVMLLRCDTSSKRYHDLITPYASKIIFVRGRIRFVGGDNAAPFPSVVVVFDKRGVLK